MITRLIFGESSDGTGCNSPEFLAVADPKQGVELRECPLLVSLGSVAV